MSDKSVRLFSDEEIGAAYRVKMQMLIVYFACLFVVLAIIITLMAINIRMISTAYDRTNQTLFTIISAFLGSVFAVLSLFFFSVKYKLTHKYVKMLKGFEKGILDSSEVKFLSFDKTAVFKDGVYFYAMTVSTKPLRRDDITQRRVLIEQTIQPPDFKENDKLKITTHGSILVAYELFD